MSFVVLTNKHEIDLILHIHISIIHFSEQRCSKPTIGNDQTEDTCVITCDDRNTFCFVSDIKVCISQCVKTIQNCKKMNGCEWYILCIIPFINCHQ